MFRNLICSKFLLKLSYFNLICFLSFGAFAHKVNIFAEIDKDAINITCYYSKGEYVRKGEIKIFETKSDKLIYKGMTDEKGFLSFKVPEAIIKDNSDIKIILNAGMGHHAKWSMPYKEILESREILKENFSLKLEKERKRNEFKKEKIIGSSEIPFSRIVLGVIMIFTIFSFTYLLRKRKRAENIEL